MNFRPILIPPRVGRSRHDSHLRSLCINSYVYFNSLVKVVWTVFLIHLLVTEKFRPNYPTVFFRYEKYILYFSEIIIIPWTVRTIDHFFLYTIFWPGYSTAFFRHGKSNLYFWEVVIIPRNCSNYWSRCFCCCLLLHHISAGLFYGLLRVWKIYSVLLRSHHHSPKLFELLISLFLLLFVVVCLKPHFGGTILRLS